KCCNIEPQILRSYNKVRGDNSPATKTELFTVLVMQCVNPQCGSYLKTWETEIPTEVLSGDAKI
ncbi:MAG: hypothetical protein RRY40_02465, partial [Oscillospiraceae bacterium]